MTKNYHSFDQPTPRGYYVLQIWKKSVDPEQSVNDPQLELGCRWFKYRSNLLGAAKEETESGNYCEAYFVISNDQTEDIRV